MKNLSTFFLTLLIIGCTQHPSEQCQNLESENIKLENNLNTYKTAWDIFFENRDPSAINTESFDEQVTVVTSSGDVTGIDAFRDYYSNYLTAFSDAEFTFVHIFGQGDKLVKQWNFKGTHDGDFFGIPATNKSLDLSGTTIVIMKDGKVFKEQDFFDNHSLLMQLGLLE